MKTKIAFFDAKPYDIASFDAHNQSFGFDIRYYDSHLNKDSVVLANGCDVVCAFVNAVIDKKVIDQLVSLGVKLIALRSAGFNNVISVR